MTTIPAYRFVSAAQWKRVLRAADGGAMTVDPADGPVVAEADCDIIAFAFDHGRPIIVDCKGILSLADGCGPSLGEVQRLWIEGGSLWAFGNGILTELDPNSFQIISSIGAGNAVDAAPGPWLLDESAVRGPNGAKRSLPEPAIAIGAAPDGLVLLTRARDALLLIDDDRVRRLVLADLLRNPVPDWGVFQAEGIAGGGKAVAVSGRWADGSAGLVLVTGEGALAGRVKWVGAAMPKLVFVDGDSLLAAFGERLLRVSFGSTGSTRWLTPMLDVETPAGQWLRAEIEAVLPEGGTLSFRWAATDDDALKATLRAMHEDESRTPTDRMAGIAHLLTPYWSNLFVYEGKSNVVERFAFPLHAAAQGTALWVELQLGGPGDIAALSVLHEGAGLMEHLPAIYRGAGDGDGSLRRLVDVVEATTQQIDDRIDDLDLLLDPARCAPRWLPALADMLGLPFDAMLDEMAQRRIVGAAAALLEHRGTRQGLIVLLGALFPGRLVRIVDRAATLFPMMLGSGALPAMLAGPAKRIARLNARLVLGATALCPASPCDDGLVDPAASLLVIIPATRGERDRLEAAVRQMIEAMIPAGVLLDLRWTNWLGGVASEPVDVLASVDAPVALPVGDGALGRMRLGGRARPGISADGTDAVGQRLM